MNNTFAQYVTRTAFQLSLSKNMVVALEIVKAYNDGLDWFHARTSHPFTYNDNWATPIRALMHRGIALHHEKPAEYKNWDYVTKMEFDKTFRYYTLTEAGHHVYALCVLAGLIVVPEDKEKAA